MPPLLAYSASAFRRESISPIRRASRAFICADESEAITTDARRPIMAMTTSNSMSVKPFDRLKASPRVFIYSHCSRKLNTHAYVYRYCSKRDKTSGRAWVSHHQYFTRIHERIRGVCSQGACRRKGVYSGGVR